MSGILNVVAGALIDAAGKILISERPAGKNLAGYWEFPGGKIEAGETPEDALVRELNEELGIIVDKTAMAFVSTVSFDYPDFRLVMPLFACPRWQGAPSGREGQKTAWADIAEIASGEYPLPPADAELIEDLRFFIEKKF